MRHALFSFALVATLMVGGTASASYTVDLIWADTGTATLTILPGDAAAPSSGNLCTDGASGLNGAGAGRCLLVRLTATAPWTASISTLGWNAASSGLAHDWTGFRSHGQFVANPTGGAGPTPASALTTNCAPACDTAWGSFGSLAAGPIGAGTYIYGSINFDTSGVLAGSHSILNFLRTGVDGATNKSFVPSPVFLNGATLNVIPEPGTASLLGLGIMGLVLAGRRKA